MQTMPKTITTVVTTSDESNSDDEANDTHVESNNGDDASNKGDQGKDPGAEIREAWNRKFRTGPPWLFEDAAFSSQWVHASGSTTGRSTAQK